MKSHVTGTLLSKPMLIASVFCTLLAHLVGCVSVPIPPGGEDAGRYGHVDIVIRYRPNFDTITQAMRRPNPDIPTSQK